jgi:hypothetical protein
MVGFGLPIQFAIFAIISVGLDRDVANDIC